MVTAIPDIETKLTAIWAEMASQEDLVATLDQYGVHDSEAVQQIGEYITDHAEYEAAYNYMVVVLELVPFKLSGPNVVSLLEVGLTFGFKTDRDEDDQYRRGPR